MRQFDPLLYLGDDVMHEVLPYVVSLWDMAESKEWGTGVVPKKYVGDPLVLMGVSRRWSQFITSSPQLWSYLLVDTDDNDVVEYLQLFFLLSRDKRLFIVLHGSGDVRDDIIMDLLRVDDRINTLLYPPNVSHSTLAKFRLYLGTSHSQLQHVRPWYKLEVQSTMQPQQDVYHYSLPASIQSLWMGGLFPLSKLVALSHFQSLSSLSVRISVDRRIPPAHKYRLELPNLEMFRVQMAVACHNQIEMPIFISCRKLKLLDLRYVLEFNPESPQDEPATWMEFDRVDALEALQIDLVIHVVSEVRLTTPLVKWLKMRRKRREQWLERQQQRLEREQRWPTQKELEELEKKEQRELLEELQRLKSLRQQRELRRQKGTQKQQKQQKQQKHQRQLEELEREELEGELEELERELEGELEGELQLQWVQREEWVQQVQQVQQVQRVQRIQQVQRVQRVQRKQRKQQEQQEQREQREQREQETREKEQHLHFMMSIRTRWLKRLNLPDYLEHVQHSSLKVSLSTQMHKEAWGVIRNTVEEALVRGLPQITDLTTSNVLYIFPKHLQTLRLHGFAISDSWPSMAFPCLVSLEIIADSPDHLLVMKYIQVPQLRVLRVLVEDGPGTLHEHDWGDNTSNILDHISLRIEIPLDKQGGIRVLVFQLPQTHSLNIFSPCTPLRLCLAKPTPTIYTLNAGLGTMSGPSHDLVPILSAMWNEELVTEWIIPYAIPSLVRSETLMSLQRIIMDQLPYLLSEPSPADTLFKLLEQNIHTCPQLTSITLAQCPSSWPRFLCRLRARNREAMLSRRTKCIDELGFYQPLHGTIIRWLVDAIKARILDVKQRPLIREGNAWPMRPLEAEDAFRSCYICHITGMELGCYESETQNTDCGRQRGDGSKIVVS